MSISSLNKFSPRLAGGGSSNPSQGLLMPKLQYRYRLMFENFGTGGADVLSLTKQVVSFSRPTVNFADIDLHTYNSIVRLAGKHTWSDVTTSIRDDAGGGVSKLVGLQLQKQFDFMEQSSAAAGIDYKFTLRCEMLDGGNGNYEPTVLETWELYGCYIKEANYQEVNYANSEAVTIQLSIRFDNAIQTTGAGEPGGVGLNVGRRAEGAGQGSASTGSGYSLLG